MKQQQGAALVIVMALLAGALMLGMSGLQSDWQEIIVRPFNHK